MPIVPRALFAHPRESPPGAGRFPPCMCRGTLPRHGSDADRDDQGGVVSGAFDAIVVGGGVMGTAATHELAARGRNTLLLERFTFGHGRGSSGGPTRIFRFTYEHPDYVRRCRTDAQSMARARGRSPVAAPAPHDRWHRRRRRRPEDPPTRSRLCGRFLSRDSARRNDGTLARVGDRARHTSVGAGAGRRVHGRSDRSRTGPRGRGGRPPHRAPKETVVERRSLAGGPGRRRSQDERRRGVPVARGGGDRPVRGQRRSCGRQTSTSLWCPRSSRSRTAVWPARRTRSPRSPTGPEYRRSGSERWRRPEAPSVRAAQPRGAGLDQDGARPIGSRRVDPDARSLEPDPQRLERLAGWASKRFPALGGGARRIIDPRRREEGGGGLARPLSLGQRQGLRAAARAPGHRRSRSDRARRRRRG